MSEPGAPKTGLMVRLPWFGASDLADDISPAAAAIGARLARLRKDRGLTQVELADKLDLTQSMLSHYERGALRLHGELIVALTSILDVTADELLGLTGKADKRTADRAKNRRLMSRLARAEALPRRDQDALMRTIDAYLDRVPDDADAPKPRRTSRR